MFKVISMRVFPVFCALALVLCCLPALAAPVSADGDILPVLPTGDFSNWYVCYFDGYFFAYNSDYTLEDKGDRYEVRCVSRYKLVDGSWVFQEYYDGGNSIIDLRYDSTGTYATKSLAIFGLPDPTEPPVTEPPVEVGDIPQKLVGFFVDFSVQNLLAVIIGAVGLASGLVLAWFAYRYSKRKVKKAIKKGKM